MKSVPITTNVVSSNPARSELDTTLRDKLCQLQWQGGGFLLVFRFPPPIKLTVTI